MKKNISILTLIMLLLGIVAGLSAKSFVSSLSFIGTIYINLLKFLIGPVVFTSITATIYHSQKNKDSKLSKAILTYVLYYFAASDCVTSQINCCLTGWFS